MKRVCLLVALTMTVVIVACTGKKDNNPLTNNNAAPTLQVVGFAADTLVYIEDRVYPFEFIVTDDGLRDPNVQTKVVGATGAVTVVDHTAEGLYKANFTPTVRGQHLIEIVASDGLESTSGSVSVFMGDNHAPVAVITMQLTERDLTNVRFTYEFDASNSSDRDESEIVKATWNLDGVEVESEVNASIEHTFTYYANYEIELTVEDEFGGIGTAMTTVDNSRPLASFAIRPASRAQNGDQVTFDASSSVSPNGQITSYRWYQRTANSGLNVLGIVSSATFNYEVGLPVGNSFIGLVVQDAGSNVSDTTWATLQVENQPPVAAFTFSTALERIMITANTSTDDDPGDTIAYSWLLDGTVLADYESLPLPTIAVPGGVYDLTLRVTDNHGDFTDVTRSGVSVPGVPEADFVFGNGVENTNQTKNGRTITLDGAPSIPGNESTGITQYSWFWRAPSQDPQFLDTSVTPRFTIDIAHDLGNYEVGLTVTNSEGLRSEEIWKVLMVINSDPVAVFQPAVSSGRTVIISSNGSFDIDPNQNDTLDFRWFIDDVEDEAVRGVRRPTWRGLPFGSHTIKLQVVDIAGGTGVMSKVVQTIQ